MAPNKAPAAPPPSWYEPALKAPSVSEKNLAVMHLMTAEGGEKRKTVLRVGSAEPEAPGGTFYPFFTSSIIAGLVPPFSDFFFSVLSHYKIHALHLHPNSVLLLSIFAFYCDAFMGVMPSVVLFHRIFYLRTNNVQHSGCAGFIAPNGSNAISRVGKKMEDFQNK